MRDIRLHPVRHAKNYRTWRHATRLVDGLPRMTRAEDRRAVVGAILKTLKAALEGR